MIGDSDLTNVINRFDDTDFIKNELQDCSLKGILQRLDYIQDCMDERLNKLEEMLYEELAEYDAFNRTPNYRVEDCDASYPSLGDDLLMHDYEQQYYNMLLDEDECEHEHDL